LPDEISQSPAITVEDIDRATEIHRATEKDSAAQGYTHVSIDAVREANIQLGEKYDSLKEELEKTKKRIRTIEILDDLIEPMATKAFWFMCVYCAVVAVLLTLHGFAAMGFYLPEGVLKFLVGSTATTVIGLVGMVLTCVFVGARGRGSY